MRPHRSNVLMLNLAALSLFCLLVLCGLFFYTGGSILPSTEGAPSGEAAQVWVIWAALLFPPTATGMLCVIRLIDRKRR